jgi:hypothetical protein
MSFVITSTEYLVIDNVPLSTMAWWSTNLDDLIATSEMRGEDILVPLGDGVRPQRRRRTVTAATIELAIVGDVGPDGTIIADPSAGLRQNMATIAALAEPDGTAADGTRVAVLHLSGTTRTGPVHVVRVRFARESPAYATAQMELSLPAGALT